MEESGKVPINRKDYTALGVHHDSTSPGVLYDRKKEEEERRAKVTMGDANEAAFATQNSMVTAYELNYARQIPDDPNWEMDWEGLIRDMDERGLSRDWLDEFDGIASEAQLQNKLRYLTDLQSNLSVLEKAGGKGIAAVLTHSILDPGMLVIEAAAGPLGVAGKASKLHKSLRAILYGGTVGAAQGAAQSALNPEYGFKELATDMAGGAAVGLAFSKAAQYLTGDELMDAQRKAADLARKVGEDRTAGAGAVGADSLGAARVKGSQVDEGLDTTFGPKANEDAMANLEANMELGDVRLDFAHARIDQFADGASHADPRVRTLTRQLHSDPVGRSDGGVNVSGATERAKRHNYSMGVQFREAFESSLAAFTKEQGIDGAKGWFNRQFNQKLRDDFNTRVGRYRVLGDASGETSPAVMKAANDIERVMNEVAKRAQKAGVHASEGMEKANFWPRVFRRDKHDFLNRKLGSTVAANEAVQQLYFNAIRNRIERMRAEKIADLEARGMDPALFDDEIPKFSEQLTHRVAEAYTKRAMGQVERKAGGPNAAQVDELVDVLETAGVDADEIDLILKAFDVMKVNKDGKDAPTGRLMRRLEMDMETSIDVDVAGKTEKLTLADLYENNAELVMDNYLREMSGHIGLAEVGYKDAREIFKMIDDLLPTDNPRNTKAHRALTAMANSLIGRPLEEVPYSTSNRAMRTMMDFNFLTRMGSVGFSMVAENGQILGLAGVRAVLDQVPALRDLAKGVLTGQFDLAAARQLSQLTGMGSSTLRSSVAIRPDDLNLPGMSNGFWGKVDKLQQSAKRFQSVFSGLTPGTDMQQLSSGLMFGQYLTTAARKGKGLPDNVMKRLRDYGMRDEEIGRMLDHLKANAKLDGSRVTDFGTDLMREDLRDAFAMMMSRMNRHVIQDLDIGAVPWFMNKAVGRMMMQFRTFTLGAYTRHTLHGMNKRDAIAASQVAYSAMFATAAYYARAYTQFSGDQERLEMALDEKNVAKAVTGMIAEFGFVPLVVDSLLGAVGEDPLFRGMNRSSNLSNNLVMGNPTVDTLNKLNRILALPTRALRPDQQPSYEDMQAFVSLLYFNKLPGMVTALNTIAPQFPRERELQQGKALREWLE
jgi:hypothetical protein